MSVKDDPIRQELDFGGLSIEHDSSVLHPREWTVMQSLWGRRLLDDLAQGAVLEVCSGAGQIGLLTVHGTDRHLVAVDASADAGRWTRHNARRHGIDSDVRVADLDDALAAHETFVLITADPPWVPADRIDRFPEDPRLAIDGGADGLVLARRILALAARHLAPAGSVLLQVGTEAQVHELRVDLNQAELDEVGRFVEPGRGVVVHLRRTGDPRLPASAAAAPQP